MGGHAVEAMARSGIGTFHLIDKDTVDITNVNRQIIATMDTVGKPKVDVMKERILSINPDATVYTYPCFFLPENADEFDFTDYDYVVDAVDTVTAKLEIIMRAKAAGVAVVSSMGAGNKLDASAFEVADIYDTSVCPLARVMRRELKKRGVTDLKVVYSKEKAMETECEQGDNSCKKSPGSVAYVPAVAGLILAGEVIKDLIANDSM